VKARAGVWCHCPSSAGSELDMQLRALIQEPKREAVARALRRAFAIDDVEDCSPLTGGLTEACVYRIVVNGTQYVLRVSPDEAKFSRQLPFVQAASEAGLAPCIRDPRPQDGILITEFIEKKPFPEDIRPRMAEVIRSVHSLPRFNSTRCSFLDLTAGDVVCLLASELLPENMAHEFSTGYQRLAQIYPRDVSSWVVSHHDLKPHNILFDGDRVWLIDWDEASVDDLYNDLAVVANNFLVEDQVTEEKYLRDYFGEPAGRYRASRFYLMRQLVHVANVALFMPWAARKSWLPGPDFQGPDYCEFHRRLIANEADLNSPDVQLEYAKVHLHRVLCNMRTPKFGDALACVAAGEACA